MLDKMADRLRMDTNFEQEQTEGTERPERYCPPFLQCMSGVLAEGMELR
jgi:hypothetical protein